MEEIWYTLTGQIDAKGVNDAICWINGQLFNNPLKRLIFLISSPGGDIDSAIRIYSYLKALPLTIKTIGFGQIDSAANIIFLAGSERVAVTGCRFFLHEGTFFSAQGSIPLRLYEENLKILRDLNRRHVELLAMETSHKAEEIQAILSESKIMSVDEAKEFGLVKEIINTLPLSRPR